MVLECRGVRRVLRRRKREADGSRRTKRHPVLNQNLIFFFPRNKFSKISYQNHDQVKRPEVNYYNPNSAGEEEEVEGDERQGEEEAPKPPPRRQPEKLLRRGGSSEVPDPTNVFHIKNNNIFSSEEQ